jgi:serine/alanine adding enzyme
MTNNKTILEHKNTIPGARPDEVDKCVYAVRSATELEIQNWNKLITKNPDGGSMLQTTTFIDTKCTEGWLPCYTVFESSKSTVYVAFVWKNITLFGRIYYCPLGPGVVTLDQYKLIEACSVSKQGLPGAFVIYFEPKVISAELDRDGNVTRCLPYIMPEIHQLRPRRINANANNTVLTTFSKKSAHDLSNWTSKARYSVRYAERSRVVVSQVDIDDNACDVMYDFMRDVQKRESFMLRDKAYYQRYWMNHDQDGLGYMYQAKLEQSGEIVASAFFSVIGKNAYYKDAGAKREYTKLGGPSAILAKAMQDFSSTGVTQLDFIGATPLDQLDTHVFSGITKFKMSIGDRHVEYVGSLMVPVRKFRYLLWKKFVERLVLAYTYRVEKRLFF